MAETGNTDAPRAVFAFLEPTFERVAAALTEDAAAAVENARQRFDEIAPSLAYLDEPRHPMALALFSCAGSLALHLALRDAGIDAHQLGQAIHHEFAQLSLPSEGLTKDLIDGAVRSQQESRPGEFVFEVVGSEGDTNYAMNVRSCAICALFSQFDAMDLVPYMCALDDLFSDMNGSGLRRTGTIALGATHCDFRYDAGGEPLRLVEQFPDRVRLTQA